MPKIRTVKPELFRHEALFEAEQYHQLPLRLGFIGLFTCCDREGRFRWQPKQLKLDIFPYDAIDMASVLDVLAARGFIIKYQVNDKFYGCIPSWKNHQCINHREIDSTLPSIENSKIILIDEFDLFPSITATSSRVSDASSTGDPRVADASTTGESRVPHASSEINSKNSPEIADEASIDKDSLAIFPEKSAVIFDACPTGEAHVGHASRANPGMPGGKGSGRELEVEEEREQEEEKEIAVNRNIVAQARPRVIFQNVLTIFNHWRSTFQHSQALLDHKREKFICQALKMGYSIQQLCDAITGCANTPHNMGDNSRNQRYDGLHIILRDSDQIERFMRNCYHPPQSIPNANKLLQSNLHAAKEWLKTKTSDAPI
jgi:hypothetical protein